MPNAPFRYAAMQLCSYAAMSKQWLVISVSIIADQRDDVAQALLELGGTAVQEQGAELITYLAPPADLDGWLAFARATLHAEFNWRWQADEDWSETWKRGL